jgi:hypothetical protein
MGRLCCCPGRGLEVSEYIQVGRERAHVLALLLQVRLPSTIFHFVRRTVRFGRVRVAKN